MGEEERVGVSRGRGFLVPVLAAVLASLASGWLGGLVASRDVITQIDAGFAQQSRQFEESRDVSALEARRSAIDEFVRAEEESYLTVAEIYASANDVVREVIPFPESALARAGYQPGGYFLDPEDTEAGRRFVVARSRLELLASSEVNECALRLDVLHNVLLFEASRLVRAGELAWWSRQSDRPSTGGERENYGTVFFRMRRDLRRNLIEAGRRDINAVPLDITPDPPEVTCNELPTHIRDGVASCSGFAAIEEDLCRDLTMEEVAES